MGGGLYGRIGGGVMFMWGRGWMGGWLGRLTEGGWSGSGLCRWVGWVGGWVSDWMDRRNTYRSCCSLKLIINYQS